MITTEQLPSSVEQDIVSAYPEQFQGGEYWLGITIDEGWKAIVLDACRQVQETLTADELRIFHWTQIKQKLGGLRMYWRPRGEGFGPEGAAGTLSSDTRERIRSIVDQAEARASATCEVCGGAGRLRRLGPSRFSRHTVLCDVCAGKPAAATAHVSTSGGQTDAG